MTVSLSTEATNSLHIRGVKSGQRFLNLLAWRPEYDEADWFQYLRNRPANVSPNVPK